MVSVAVGLQNIYAVSLTWGNSVSIVSGYRLDDRAIKVRSPAEAKGYFPLASV
jgi:hypothetical protein